ncbi:hypothetical protein [Caulobacter hibisci]|uniref:Uncharacterized protein n=1 Tax=Caulobacter hibisci TaxID=2035993 RepID=A0ABS0SYT8_9CAUL|nr:hypothetical protein [Caulobacter hibisci]MBI1684714.1 hypothetical protein [Caulobacter hibisci]
MIGWTATAMLALAMALADPWSVRAGDTSEAFAARLKAREAEALARPLDIAAADDLASLRLAGASASAADYAARSARLDAALARSEAEIAALRAASGPADSRWMKDRDAATDPDARDLFARVDFDQRLMRYGGDLDGPEGKALQTMIEARVNREVAANAAWLKGVLARIGWFDISRHGEEASQAAWLLVQHADHDPAWQVAVLADLKPRVARGDMQGKYYAYLDRSGGGERRPRPDLRHAGRLQGSRRLAARSGDRSRGAGGSPRRRRPGADRRLCRQVRLPVTGFLAPAPAFGHFPRGTKRLGKAHSEHIRGRTSDGRCGRRPAGDDEGDGPGGP